MSPLLHPYQSQATFLTGHFLYLLDIKTASVIDDSCMYLIGFFFECHMDGMCMCIPGDVRQRLLDYSVQGSFHLCWQAFAKTCWLKLHLDGEFLLVFLDIPPQCG